MEPWTALCWELGSEKELKGSGLGKWEAALWHNLLAMSLAVWEPCDLAEAAESGVGKQQSGMLQNHPDPSE